MKLANSRFVTGPRDDLAAVDVYEVTDGAVRNRASGVVGGFIDGALNILRNTPGIRDALELLGDLGNLSDLNPEELQRRLDAILGLSRGDFRKLTDELRQTIMDQLGVEMANGGGMKSIVFGNTVDISPQKANQVQLLTGVLRNMTDDESMVELIDLAAETALYSGLLKEAVDAGMPDAIRVIEEQASDPIVVRKASLEAIGSAIASGDLYAIETLMFSAGPRQVMARYPDICRRILETYRFPLGQKPDYDTEHTRIIELLNTFDPAWATTQRGEVDVTKLNVFSRASRDAVVLFTSKGDERPYLAEMIISRSYFRNNLRELLREQYPFAVI